MTKIFTIYFLILSPLCALAQSLPSFKDSLFNHQHQMSSSYSGRLKVFHYDEMRDVNGRDEIPVKKAKAQRVASLPSGAQRSDKIAGLSLYRVGRLERAKFAVVFVHGKGGNRSLGVDDWSFGGNFNRLKNMIYRGGGVYLSPTLRLSRQGVKKLAPLINEINAKAGSIPIVLACGSMGGSACWTMAAEPEVSQHLAGLILLGTASLPNDFGQYPSVREGLPVVFAHGSLDPILDLDYVRAVVEPQIKRRRNLRLYIYDGGIHGTPIRMIDWRESINWILSR